MLGSRPDLWVRVSGGQLAFQDILKHWRSCEPLAQAPIFELSVSSQETLILNY